MSNVRPLPGLPNPEDAAKPNPELIQVLREALAMAESGQLQSYVGTGWTCDGLRLSTWADHHQDQYQMLGAIEWLKAEWIERRTRERT